MNFYSGNLNVVSSSTPPSTPSARSILDFVLLLALLIG